MWPWWLSCWWFILVVVVDADGEGGMVIGCRGERVVAVDAKQRGWWLVVVVEGRGLTRDGEVGWLLKRGWWWLMQDGDGGVVVKGRGWPWLTQDREVGWLSTEREGGGG